MIIDWNWFFSSFSQSAAALLGIIGAFLITRLLNTNEKVNSLIYEFEDLKASFEHIKDSLKIRRFGWYSRNVVRYDESLKDNISANIFNNKTKKEILEIIYNGLPYIYKVDNNVWNAYEELVEQLKIPQYNEPQVGIYDFPKLNIAAFDIKPVGLDSQLTNEKDLINKLEVEAKHQIRQFENNLNRLNTFNNTFKAIYVIIITIIIAFPITVVYPLHSLPITLNHHPELTFDISLILSNFLNIKNILLLFFFISLEVIFFYFLFLVKKMSSSINKTLLQHNEDYRKIENYSQYFIKKN